MSPKFDAAGIVDLSQFVKDAAAEKAVAAGAQYVTELTEANLEDIIRKSLTHVVVIELNSPQANAAQMSQVLARLANESAGRFLLACADVSAQPQLAAAFQVQAVPAVFALLGGQVAPLWQGTKDEAEIRAVIDQLISVAVQNGITGRADPVLSADSQEADPRFAAAEAALAGGDFAAAADEYAKILTAFPDDEQALAGKAHAELMLRTAGMDLAQAAQLAAAGAGADFEAQLQGADALMILNQPEAAFQVLLTAVRQNTNPLREQARVRLLELFAVLGNADPRVNTARRELMAALF